MDDGESARVHGIDERVKVCAMLLMDSFLCMKQ